MRRIDHVAASGSAAQIVPLTFTVGGYSFGAVPQLKLFASVATPMDTAKLTGLAWPTP